MPGALLGFQCFVVMSFRVLFVYAAFPFDAVALFEVLGLQFVAVLVDFVFFGALGLRLYAVLVYFDVMFVQLNFDLFAGCPSCVALDVPRHLGASRCGAIQRGAHLRGVLSLGALRLRAVRRGALLLRGVLPRMCS